MNLLKLTVCLSLILPSIYIKAYSQSNNNLYSRTIWFEPRTKKHTKDFFTLIVTTDSNTKKWCDSTSIRLLDSLKIFPGSKTIVITEAIFDSLVNYLTKTKYIEGRMHPAYFYFIRIRTTPSKDKRYYYDEELTQYFSSMAPCLAIRHLNDLIKYIENISASLELRESIKAIKADIMKVYINDTLCEEHGSR